MFQLTSDEIEKSYGGGDKRPGYSSGTYSRCEPDQVLNIKYPFYLGGDTQSFPNLLL